MSSKLQPYTLPSVVRSSLFKNQPEAVPPIDELDLLHSELQLLRQKTLERAKKAGDDLKTIEESMRRAKEKAKGKAKAMERVNRERGCTSLHSVPAMVLIHFPCPPHRSSRTIHLICLGTTKRLDSREKNDVFHPASTRYRVIVSYAPVTQYLCVMDHLFGLS